MKKKMKILLLAPVGALLLTSCVLSQKTIINDNAIGKKVGIVKAGPLKFQKDLSAETAAKNGGISKISVVETKDTWCFFHFRKTTVWGE